MSVYPVLFSLSCGRNAYSVSGICDDPLRMWANRHLRNMPSLWTFNTTVCPYPAIQSQKTNSVSYTWNTLYTFIHHPPWIFWLPTQKENYEYHYLGYDIKVKKKTNLQMQEDRQHSDQQLKKNGHDANLNWRTELEIYTSSRGSSSYIWELYCI